jgi:hypothetical protein
MARNSKHKRKKRKQKVVPKIPQPKPLAIASKPSKHGLLLTVLGLVLTAAGLVTLIEMFPRLSATASSPLDQGNQLASSKFTVSNDGYWQVTDVVSACYLWKVTEGGFHFTDSMARVAVPAGNILSPTEGYTVPCVSENMFAVGPPFALKIKQADLAIAVYYRPWPFTIVRKHRLFRFVARIGREGEVVWDKQPAADLEADFDNNIAAHGGTFPPQFPNRSD